MQHQFSTSTKHRQQGVATLLAVVVVGLAVSVGVASAVYALRGNQAKQLTTHSSTAAQAAAWRGVEALRQYLLQVDSKQWPGLVGADEKAVNGLDGLGVKTAVITSVQKVGSNAYQVVASVTGQSGAGEAFTTATVEVMYDLVPGKGTPGTPAVCSVKPKAPMVFNGDLIYSGGGLEVTNGADYKNIVVAGNLKVAGGSAARISGCIKGNADIAGGSLLENGHLYSEGDIAVSGSIPKNISLWGRDVTLDNVGANAVALVQAGAYTVTVSSNGTDIGTSFVGGQLLTNASPVPWVAGTLLPKATVQDGNIIITTTAGDVFLLDLSSPLVTIDVATGVVTGAASAERLSGAANAVLPDSLRFTATAVYGGTLQQKAYDVKAGKLWGFHIPVLARGDYATLWAAGNVATKGATIGQLLGGGDFALSGWEPFSVASGQIAGKFTTSTAGKPAGLQEKVANKTPGLPGRAWCDARVSAIAADDFKEFANYIFEAPGGVPQLTIQHVKKSDGTVIDGVYPLGNPSPAQLAILQDLMTCNNGNDTGCRAIFNGSSWTLLGVGKMPPGVLWFDAGLAINSSAVELRNSVISKGNLSLGDAGGLRKLTAPNFAGAAQVCGAAYYPSNLCKSSSELMTWEDENGDEHIGLPIANMSLIGERNAYLTNWQIKGSVLLGETLSTSGAMVNIQGSLTVGSNQTSNTTISAGGISVDVPSGGDLDTLPLCKAGIKPIPYVPATAGVTWSRYR